MECPQALSVRRIQVRGIPVCTVILGCILFCFSCQQQEDRVSIAYKDGYVQGYYLFLKHMRESGSDHPLTTEERRAVPFSYYEEQVRMNVEGLGLDWDLQGFADGYSDARSGVECHHLSRVSAATLESFMSQVKGNSANWQTIVLGASELGTTPYQCVFFEVFEQLSLDSR